MPFIIIMPEPPPSEGPSNFRGMAPFSMAATTATWHKLGWAKVSAGIAWSTRRAHL
jgi:hypothetical protein